MKWIYDDDWCAEQNECQFGYHDLKWDLKTFWKWIPHLCYNLLSFFSWSVANLGRNIPHSSPFRVSPTSLLISVGSESVFSSSVCDLIEHIKRRHSIKILIILRLYSQVFFRRCRRWWQWTFAWKNPTWPPFKTIWVTHFNVENTRQTCHVRFGILLLENDVHI
jgi:hypothetical protein